VEFEWHEDKNRGNIEKHGIDFADAIQIWDGATHEVRRAETNGEERITVIGQLQGRYIAVVYTKRGDRFRVISARAANRKERPGR